MYVLTTKTGEDEFVFDFADWQVVALREEAYMSVLAIETGQIDSFTVKSVKDEPDGHVD